VLSFLCSSMALSAKDGNKFGPPISLRLRSGLGLRLSVARGKRSEASTPITRRAEAIRASISSVVFKTHFLRKQAGCLTKMLVRAGRRWRDARGTAADGGIRTTAAQCANYAVIPYFWFRIASVVSSMKAAARSTSFLLCRRGKRKIAKNFGTAIGVWRTSGWNSKRA